MTDTNRRTILKASVAAAATTAIPSKAAAKDKPMAGKSVLITGCSSGFGYLGALHYASLGAKVIASMRNLPRDEAARLAAESVSRTVKAGGHKHDISIIEIDVLSDESVAKGVAEAEKIAGGAIDILINNAGIGMAGPIEVQDLEATKLMFDTNVFGPQRMMRAALPAMRKRKSGQIFNISSQLGRVMVPGYGQYSPSKFALEAMSEQMAYELVTHGIDVTIIQPGGYPTAIWKKRNAYDNALLKRTDKALLDAYGPFTARMGNADGGGRNADPMDIPRAIAEIAAMPAGKRPIRRAVHPGPKPQTAINEVSAKTQQAMFEGSPFGMLAKAVHD